MGILHLTNKQKQKVKYKTINGKLCIEHNILLQQLQFRKKDKNDEYKNYYSYFIKLPRAIYTLINPTDDLVYLKKHENKIIILPEEDENTKKVKIQLDNKSQCTDSDDYRYKLTIPKKYLNTTQYQTRKSYIICQITAKNNKTGYEITLTQKI